MKRCWDHASSDQMNGSVRSLLMCVEDRAWFCGGGTGVVPPLIHSLHHLKESRCGPCVWSDRASPWLIPEL